jgi:hypothetical protein
MQAYFNLIKRLVKAFEASGLDYAFTGAMAASFYGLPRTTTDVDLMVQVSDKLGKSKLIRTLTRAGMRANEKEIDRALASGYRIATFGDRKTAYTTDIIISNEKLQKRVGAIAGIQTFFQTPEDLILAKLRMIKATVPKERAQKDKEDIGAILRFTVVDVEAIRNRAKKETTFSILEALTAY